MVLFRSSSSKVYRIDRFDPQEVSTLKNHFVGVVAFAITLTAVLVIAFSDDAAATDETDGLFLDPAEAEVEDGEEFTVTVTVDSDEAYDEVAARLEFDPGDFTVVDVDFTTSSFAGECESDYGDDFVAVYCDSGDDELIFQNNLVEVVLEFTDNSAGEVTFDETETSVSHEGDELEVATSGGRYGPEGTDEPDNGDNESDDSDEGDESDESDDSDDSPARSSARLWGTDRMETAVQISREQYTDPDEVRDVFVASGEDFPDALSAGSTSTGPILLVPSDGPVPANVRDEISRLDPEQLIVLGGFSAVSQETGQQAADAAGLDPLRLAGADRWETSVLIAEYGFPSGSDRVYLASGEDFPDALAAGALDDGPILLAPSSGDLPSATSEYLAEENPDEVIVIGGTAAISDNVLDAAAEAAGADDTDRLAGQDRIETAIAVSNFAFEGQSERVYFARADLFPDALAGSVLTGDGPILLVHTDELPGAVANEIDRLDPFEVVTLGGRAAVEDSVLDAATGR